MLKEVLAFKNKSGEQLVGVLHKPKDASAQSKRKGIILSNTGTHYRVAWHRLNVTLAGALCDAGYYVLRFDPHGIGDSEGELDNTGEIIRHFNAIQQGLFVEDTIAAIDAFKGRYSIQDLCLAGVCGGALSSILTSGVDPRVGRIIFIAGPVTISSEMDFQVLHPVYAKELFWLYLRKVMKPRAWWRLVTRRSDYGLIKETIVSVANEGKIKKEMMRVDGEGVQGDLFNEKFLLAFKRTMERQGKILFVMPEIDPAKWQFENYFAGKHLVAGNPYEGRYQYSVVERANHTFSTEASQTRLIELVLGWLRKDE